MDGLLAVAFVRYPHGVSGECNVISASGEYAHILALKEVVLCRGEKRERRTVESARMASSCALVKFAGIDSPEAARKYSGWEMLAPRENAYQLKEGEWYIDDLRGCSLVYAGGNGLPGGASAETVGVIVDVVEGGASHLFEVRLDEHCALLSDGVKFSARGKIRTVYVPFTDEHIGEIDITRKTVRLLHLWILE